jgi:thioredoxin 2
MANDPILLRCPSCNALNRVPPDKLSSHPICGKCKTLLKIPKIPVDATTATFEHEVFDWPEYALLEFWAKWCGYCRMVEPIVNDLASWRAGRLKIVRVDIDAEPALAKQYMVKGTPIFILFKNGTQIARREGAPKEKIELVQWVDQFVR